MTDITPLAEWMGWEEVDGGLGGPAFAEILEDESLILMFFNGNLTPAGTIAVLEKMPMPVLVKAHGRWYLKVNESHTGYGDLCTAVRDAALAWLREGE